MSCGYRAPLIAAMTALSTLFQSASAVLVTVTKSFTANTLATPLTANTALPSAWPWASAAELNDSEPFSTTFCPTTYLRAFGFGVSSERTVGPAFFLAEAFFGFSAGGASDVVSALTEDIAAGRMKIIIDLRGNPGGFVDAARKVASQFVKDEPIFWQEDSKGTQTPTQALADGVATNPAIKIVLLIDKGSASASEIVAGALQDLDRATLIGETSYGKGTVQQWTELGSGGAGLKLTVARWLTPDKRWIHNVGVVPDIQVKVPADLPAGSDPALDRAIELLGGSAGASSIDQQLLRSAA